METIQLSREGKRFWNTKKNRAFITIATPPFNMAFNGAWNGGSRDIIYRYSKKGLIGAVPISMNPPQFGGEMTMVKLESDHEAIVNCGILNGKEATLHIFLFSKDGWTF